MLGRDGGGGDDEPRESDNVGVGFRINLGGEGRGSPAPDLGFREWVYAIIGGCPVANWQ